MAISRRLLKKYVMDELFWSVNFETGWIIENTLVDSIRGVRLISPKTANRYIGEVTAAFKQQQHQQKKADSISISHLCCRDPGLCWVWTIAMQA